MKNPILTLSLLVIMSGIMLTNCQSTAKKVDKTGDKAQDTENYLAGTQSDSVNVLQDTTTAYQKFIEESENRINTYERSIADLKIKIAEEKKTEKAEYEKKLVQLEQKNKALKTKVINYKNKQIDDWRKKQVEFKKDLDELGSAIADFFVKDK